MGSSAHPISPAYGFECGKLCSCKTCRYPNLCDSRSATGGQNAKQARGIERVLIDQAHSKAKESA